ncbi:MAG: DNA repair protein RadC [Myxococcales bacterium]|nr:DNA repair protein RadC [Myxococcales bacterium]
MLFDSPHERPRERMMLYGREQLSEVELLALILGGGHAVARGMALLQESGGLMGLERATPQQMCRTPGVGMAGAAAICAALELGRRVALLQLPYARAIECPADVAEFLRASIGSAPQETFLVLGLDARQRLQMIRTIAKGSLASVQVHPREVFRPLVQAGMHAVILVHNHPSGEAEPSDADVILTHRMARVGELLGIPVLDHLVVTREAIASLAELGFVAEVVGPDGRTGWSTTRRRPWEGGADSDLGAPARAHDPGSPFSRE